MTVEISTNIEGLLGLYMNIENELSWISDLSEDELFKLILSGKIIIGDHSQTIDNLGNKLLPKAIDGDIMYAHWPDYWEQLKKEFILLICTKDKKYSSLRKKLSTSADKSQTAIVSTIAAAMAASFGVAMGILVPFCAMILLALLRIGKEAFCATLNLNTPLIENTKK